MRLFIFYSILFCFAIPGLNAAKTIRGDERTLQNFIIAEHIEMCLDIIDGNIKIVSWADTTIEFPVNFMNALKTSVSKQSSAQKKEEEFTLPVVEALLQNKDFVIDPQQAGSILYNASLFNNQESLKLLLDKGFDINAKDAKGNTALHAAVAANRLDIIDLLCSRGANVNTQNNKGQTPLALACNKGYCESINKMLAQNADVNTPDNDGNTPLHILAQTYDNNRPDQRNCFDHIMQKSKNINAQNKNGQTALHITADKRLAFDLLNAHANVNLQDSQGNTPLHFLVNAYKKPSLSRLDDATLNRIARDFLEKGADPSLANNAGETASGLVPQDKKELKTMLATKQKTSSSSSSSSHQNQNTSGQKPSPLKTKTGLTKTNMKCVLIATYILSITGDMYLFGKKKTQNRTSLEEETFTDKQIEDAPESLFETFKKYCSDILEEPIDHALLTLPLIGQIAYLVQA